MAGVPSPRKQPQVPAPVVPAEPAQAAPDAPPPVPSSFPEVDTHGRKTDRNTEIRLLSYDAWINKYAQEYNVEPDFIKSIIRQESKGLLGAKSKTGVRGVMQVTRATAAQYGVTDRNDPEQSIRAGTAYLADLLKMFNGDKVKAAAAYNSGPSGARDLKKLRPEGREYVRKIFGVDVVKGYDPNKYLHMGYKPGEPQTAQATAPVDPVQAGGMPPGFYPPLPQGAAPDAPAPSARNTTEQPLYFGVGQQKEMQAAVKKAEERAREKAAAGTTFGERYDAAVRLNHLFPNLRNWFETRQIGQLESPDYVPPSPDLLFSEMQTAGVPAHFAPRLEEATSDTHRSRILAGIRQELEAQRTLAEGGIGSTLGISILGGLSDPLTAPLNLIPAAPVIRGAKAIKDLNRSKEALKGMAIGGAVGTAVEVPQSLTQETRGLDDALAGIALSSVLGGMFRDLAQGSTRELRDAILASDAAALKAHKAVKDAMKAGTANKPLADVVPPDIPGTALKPLPPDWSGERLPEKWLTGEVLPPEPLIAQKRLALERPVVEGELADPKLPGPRALPPPADGPGVQPGASPDPMVPPKPEPAVPDKVAENDLKVSEALAAAKSANEVVTEAQRRNTFTYDTGTGYGERQGFPQRAGTPPEKLFSNFADDKKSTPEQRSEFRKAMLDRAVKRGDFTGGADTSRLPFRDGIAAEVSIPTARAKPGVRVVLKDETGDVVGAAYLENGMIDSIAVAEKHAGKGIGADFLKWLDAQKLANIREVPDRSPGFVAIQRRVLSELGASPAKPTAPSAEGAPFGPGSVGAAQAEQVGVWNLKEDVPDHWYEYPLAWGMRILRYDPVGYLKNRANPVFKFFGHHAGEDGVGINADGSAARISVEEHTEAMRAASHSQWLRETNAAFKEADDGAPILGRDARRAEFMERVAYLYEQHALPENMTAAENAAVNAARKYFTAYERALIEADVVAARGLGKGTKAYLPHIVDPYKFREAVDNFRVQQVEDLLYGSLLRRQLAKADLDGSQVDDATKQFLRYMSKGYINGVMKRGTLRDMIGTHGFSLDDRPSIRQFLQDAGIHDTRIDEVLDSVGRPSKDGPARLKQRFDFDMGHSITGRDKNGEMKVLKMTDLFERNLDRLVPMYGRQVAGHIAFAKYMGIKSRGDFQKLRALAADPSVNTLSDGETKRGLKYMDYLYDAITGNPLEADPGSALSVWGRRIRDFNFLRTMNQVGFAQAVESARTLAQIGLGPFLKQMPVIKEFRALAKDGKLSNDLLREMEAMIGIGTFRLRNQVFTGATNEGEFAGGRLDQALHRGKNITATISGMNFITELQSKMAAAGMAQRVADMVRKGTLSKGNVRELASLGIDEKMAERIAEGVDAHARFGAGKALHELNLEEWTDQEAANALIMGINRSARRLVQENSYGTSNPFMHSTAGKFLFQFRSFMMNAFFKQTMHGVAMRDAANTVGLLTTSLLGGMSYTLQTLLNETDEEKLDKKLAPEKIALAGFNRSGYSSLIPATTDTAIGLLTGGTVGGMFAHGRSSGLGTGLIAGNPSVDLINKGARALAGGPNALLRDDYELSQADVQAMAGVLPYQNALGIRRGISALLEGLPRESSKGTPNAYDLLFEQ